MSAPKASATRIPTSTAHDGTFPPDKGEPFLPTNGRDLVIMVDHDDDTSTVLGVDAAAVRQLLAG